MAYVYALIDPRDESWFYVGKGNGRRISKHFIPSNLQANTHKTYKIRSIEDSGYEPYGEKLLVGVSDELACFVEGELIDKHYDDLTNYCRGGEPRWSKGMPKEVRQKIRENTSSLQEQEVAEIKWLAQANYRQSDIAKVYGVGVGAISPIKHNKNFSSVEPQKPEPLPDGLGKGWTQLSKKEASEVKWLSQRKYRRTSIADIYSISANHVYRIKVGESYRNLEAERPQSIPDSLDKTGLTDTDIGEIKYLSRESDLTQSKIASQYNVNQSQVSRIKRGKRHSSVTKKKPK